MHDVIDLCNRALLMLGVAPLQTLEDPTSEAEVVRTFYPMVRDRVLAAHPWSFATRTVIFETGHREGIPGDTPDDTPDNIPDDVLGDTEHEKVADPHFPYRMPLPSRCVRVVTVSRFSGSQGRSQSGSQGGRSPAVPYRVMGSALACPHLPIVVEYIAAVPEAGFPAFFIPVVTTHLAAAVCLPLTENTHRADHLTRAAERELHHARRLDMGSQPPPVLAGSILLDVRQ